MAEIINANSIVIGSLLIFFGMLILGLALWEGELSKNILLDGKRVKRGELKNLHENMILVFNLAELEQFCFKYYSDLQINYEDLPGVTLTDKTRELILACERRGKRDALIQACKKERPNVKSWLESPGKNLSRPSIARPVLYIFGSSGIVLLGIGVVLVSAVSPPPPVTLLGMRYMIGDWDPRQLDLSAAAVSGIPASGNDSLQFMGLAIGVAQNAPEFTVKAEVYNDETLVGYSDPVPLLQGQKIDSLFIVEAYQHPIIPAAWQVQPAWKTLRLSLVVEKDGRSPTTANTTIRLNPLGDAWYIEPPTGQITTIVYSVNHGAPLVLDLRTLGAGNGINVASGDTLTIHNVWYHAVEWTQKYATLQLEAHLNTGNYDWETAQKSTPVTFQAGIHPLLSSDPFEWIVPEGRENLTIWLARNDRTVLDKLNIPLASQATAGLIPIEEASLFAGDVPDISLLSISFELGNYNPRLVDLRANPPTIPVIENSLLEFSEIWLRGDQADPNLWVWVEIFSNETLTNIVGHSEAVRLLSRRMKLGQVVIKAGADENVTHNWRVPAEWRDLYIAVLGQHEDSENSMLLDIERIHFDKESAAWLNDSPNASIVSVAYSVNANPPKLIDLRAIETAGIVAAPGDTLAITGIWYHFMPTHQERGSAYMEAHLSQSGSYEQETRRATGLELLQEGSNRLNSTSELSWTVAEDMNRLYLSLTDLNGAIIDRLFIAINAETGAHLVPEETSIIWPFDLVDYIDFENEAEMAGVSGNPPFTKVVRSQEKAFSGNYSLAVTTVSTDTVFVKWEYPFQADVVSLQVYWPDLPGYVVHWAEACLIDGSICWGVPTAAGRWNTATMNFFAPSYGDPENQMHNQEIGGFYIQCEISGVGPDKPYTFFVDGIQVSPAP